MLTFGPTSLASRRVTVAAPFFQAGLAGYSDAAMRLVARRHGCPLCVTEAMLDQFLINGGKGLDAARLVPGDHGQGAPIVGQLMGSHPKEIAEGARILVDLGYDIVDVNLACPVKKIKKKARGGHLLSVPDEAVAILESVMAAVGGEVPVTVKLRRAYDDTPEMAEAFTRVFERAMMLGLSGAVVHSRTVAQKYRGPGYRPFLRRLTDAYGAAAKAQGFVIGGSGDVWTAEDIFRMIEETGVDIVSVARGCIGNPWVFEQAQAFLRTGDRAELRRVPGILRQRGVLLEHFELSAQIHGEAVAGREMRKFGIRFSRLHPRGAEVKNAFIGIKGLADWRAALDHWYGEDGPGADYARTLPPEASLGGTEDGDDDVCEDACGAPVGEATDAFQERSA